jgi:hypothetical protein
MGSACCSYASNIGCGYAKDSLPWDLLVPDVQRLVSPPPSNGFDMHTTSIGISPCGAVGS